MTTKNIECQLAQGQIGRYLNGDRFSAEAVKQLESHISECEECTELLNARKAAVMAMLGSQVPPTHAVVQMDAPSPATTAAVKLLKALSQTGAPAAEAVSSATEAPNSQSLFSSLLPKPMLYCGGLALVLLGMSYFSKGALKILGPTVGSTLASDPSPEATKPPVAKAQPKPAPVASNPAPTSAPKPAPTPKPVSDAPTPAPKTTQVTPAKTVAPKPLKAKAPMHQAAKAASVKPTPHFPKKVSHAARRASVNIAVRRFVHRFRATVHRPFRRAHPLRTARVRTHVRAYDLQGQPLR